MFETVKYVSQDSQCTDKDLNQVLDTASTDCHVW